YYEAHGKRIVGNSAYDIQAFLWRELSLGGMADMLKHLWFAGAERAATPLHFYVAMGREIAIADRMDLHLLWTNRKLFVKPIPRFLLDFHIANEKRLLPRIEDDSPIRWADWKALVLTAIQVGLAKDRLQTNTPSSRRRTASLSLPSWGLYARLAWWP
ncbi:hypothetical protein B0T16DRAFT_334880, partial [Cercophora newfieldiana]